MKTRLLRPLIYMVGLPFTFLWENIYRIRRFAYKYGFLKQNNFRVPIISIGNLTFGGTGKTPFTLWVSEYLETLDKTVMILMRGYKGKLESSSGIIRSKAKIRGNPVDYGDEALILSRRLEKTSIVVGKNRSENLDFYFKDEEPDVVLLDDGHQHLKLHRNINILLFDSLLPINRYKVAPLGYMRESFSAIKDADLIVLGRSDQVSEKRRLKLKKFLHEKSKGTIPFAEIGYKPTGIMDCSFNKVMDVEGLKEKRVICVSGIASPLSFYSLVDSLGADIIHRESFPDHHYFKPEEISRLLDLAEKEDALILTTEKDIVKIRRVSDNERIVYLEIKVNFFSGEDKAKEIISRAFINSI
ncbi:tetraacyldisaccharide 4'-kinase [Halobacteriovorax sp. GB3]|uniref:tetraacyldisaccharide 4'-kinase n=1 Tax=Halobacteriovorax sp. GB3 TaxID=2719615 RepID=UPI0023611FAD|nr:tetraacyldisaccharide 4'-kinase [Halobacteriovorax sp. GB3]MDD0854092.1 tetraacyldisaccharide 4'-kinase [Halobacteriovorax sp. GB3]